MNRVKNNDCIESERGRGCILLSGAGLSPGRLMEHQFAAREISNTARILR